MFMGDLKEFFGLWHLHVETFVLKADRAAGLEAHSEPTWRSFLLWFPKPWYTIPRALRPQYSQAFQPLMHRRAFLDSAKCQCHDNFEKKAEKNSKEKIKRSFKTIRDKEVNHT